MSEKKQGFDIEWERQNTLKGFPCWAEKELQHANLLCFNWLYYNKCSGQQKSPKAVKALISSNIW